MAIQSSSAREVERLIAELRDGDDVRRDAAVARLRVIGNRSIGRLSELVSGNAPAAVRAAALRSLDGLDDVRAQDVALAAVDDDNPAVAVAALAVLRGWITREPGTRVLDTVTRIALDREKDVNTRLAAVDALADLPPHLVAPIVEQVSDLSPAPSTLPDAATTREWLASARDASLSELHRIITHARERERAEPSRVRRQEWLAARGQAHVALARRPTPSRVALYDLRETFDEARHPLPPDFLTAMTALGDAGCLDALGRAWAAAAEQPSWRERLEETARAIMRRDKISGRSAAVKRLREKWPGFI